jgi:hypothetical protein
MGFDGLVVVSMKMAVFWLITYEMWQKFTSDSGTATSIIRMMLVNFR